MAFMDELPPLDELEKIQARNREQMAENRQKVMERKARSSRLYRRGAIIEQLIPKSAEMTDEQFKRLFVRMIQQAANKKEGHRS